MLIRFIAFAGLLLCALALASYSMSRKRGCLMATLDLGGTFILLSMAMGALYWSP